MFAVLPRARLVCEGQAAAGTSHHTGDSIGIQYDVVPTRNTRTIKSVMVFRCWLACARAMVSCSGCEMACGSTWPTKQIWSYRATATSSLARLDWRTQATTAVRRRTLSDAGSATPPASASTVLTYLFFVRNSVAVVSSGTDWGRALTGQLAVTSNTSIKTEELYLLNSDRGKNYVKTRGHHQIPYDCTINLFLRPRITVVCLTSCRPNGT